MTHVASNLRLEIIFSAEIKTGQFINAFSVHFPLYSSLWDKYETYTLKEKVSITNVTPEKSFRGQYYVIERNFCLQTYVWWQRHPFALRALDEEVTGQIPGRIKIWETNYLDCVRFKFCMT